MVDEGGVMMRTMKIGTWRVAMLMLTALYLGTNAWAQSSGGSTPGVSSGEPQVAQPPDGGVNWKGVGIGAGTIVTNLAYVPAKLVYGILGGIGGAAGYALTGGNKQVADSIWRSSLGGDYVLTPDMMTGQRPIYFSGPSDTSPMQATPSGSSLPPSAAVGTPGAAVSAPAAAAGTGPTTRPIDNGAGPVSATGGSRPTHYAGVNNPGSSYQGQSRPPTVNESPLPDTSIE
jgi:hypothetical protein